MQSPAEVIDLAALYLKIYFLGMPSVMLYNFGAAILRGVGDTKRPLYYLTFSGVVNVVLNFIFVVGFHMDVAGVALATIISQTISAFFIIRCLMREESLIRLQPQYLGVDKSIFLRILQIGLPAGGNQTFVYYCIQLCIVWFDGLYGRCNSWTWIFCNADDCIAAWCMCIPNCMDFNIFPDRAFSYD